MYTIIITLVVLIYTEIMKNISVIIGCIILCIGLVFIVRVYTPAVSVHTSYQTQKVLIGQVEYILEVADTDSLREQGLSYRTSLAPQTGMLFMFDTPQILKFWMKDMNFPIDIIWLDENKTVLQIEHSLSLSTYSASFSPDSQTQYVIEIPVGDVGRIGVKMGDGLVFV